MKKARPQSDRAASTRPPRAGWADAARRMHAAGVDRLLDPPQSTTFDDQEWEWRPAARRADTARLPRP